MTNDQTPTTQPSQEQLTTVKEYTVEQLTEATQKNELGDYLRFPKQLEAQLQEKLNRADLKIDDFVAFGLKVISKIDVQAIHVGRAWNNRKNICSRLGIALIECPAERAKLTAITESQPMAIATADTTKPNVFELPRKPIIQQIGTLGVVKSDSVETQVLDLKSKMDELIKKL